MGFQYNSKLRAPEVLLQRGHAPRLIRRRETNSDLFANAIEFLPGRKKGGLNPLWVKAGVAGLTLVTLVSLVVYGTKMRN